MGEDSLTSEDLWGQTKNSMSNQLSVITEGVTFIAQPRSHSHSRSPSLHAPPSPLGFGLQALPSDHLGVSPSDTSPSSGSPYHDANFMPSAPSSPYDEFHIPEYNAGHYPDNLSSSWANGLGNGLGITGASHVRAASLDVPGSGLGPIRSSSHGHSSSVGSMSEEGHHRGRSGSGSRGSPYARPESLQYSPVSPHHHELLAPPDVGASLHRRNTSPSGRPMLRATGLGRHRTVTGATGAGLHTHSLSTGSISPSQLHAPSAQYPQSAGHSPADISSPLPTVDPAETTTARKVRKTTVGSAAIASAATGRRTEGREAKFACKVEGCTSTFTAKHNLTNHMNSHLGVQPFSCPRCSRPFTTKGVMQRHTKTCKSSSPS